MNFLIKSKSGYSQLQAKSFLRKRNIISLFKELLGLSFLLIGRSFYIKSLKGCDGDEFKCVVINIKYIFDDIHYCLRAIFYFWCFLLFFYFKIISKYQIIIFFFIIFELLLKDTGDSFLHHGILNFIALLVILSLGEILILLFIFIINIKNKKISFLIFIILILHSLIFFNNNKDKYFCKNWDRGLNGSFISNNETLYPCSIIIPKNKCLIDILSPIFDLSKILNIRCENRKEKEKYLLKNSSNLKIYKKIKKIGFPITKIDKEEIKGKSALYSKSLMEFVRSNLINLDDENILKNLTQNKKAEIIIDFTNNPFGELKQEINFNKSLSNERLKSGSNHSSNNILFLFFDNLSRVHFYRQYKKTSNFIKNFLSFKGYSSNNNQIYHGFEFFKYHKFFASTAYNVIPMFSGVYFYGKNRMISLVKEMKKEGYVTCNVQDVCHKGLMMVENVENFTYIEFDHEYAAPNCDPNVYNFGYGIFSGENGILRKCLYGKESIEHAFEYGKNFWKAYKENKKFLRIVNNYGHEYSGEKSKYVDLALYNFLLFLFNSGQLINTSIFFVGDHGNMLLGAYQIFKPNDIEIEQYFPILIIITNDLKNTSYSEQYSEIIKNQQTFITSFDIYFTLREIIFGNEYKDNLLKEQIGNGESLFKYINPKERSCDKYIQIDKCYCNNNK